MLMFICHLGYSAPTLSNLKVIPTKNGYQFEESELQKLPGSDPEWSRIAKNESLLVKRNARSFFSDYSPLISDYKQLVFEHSLLMYYFFHYKDLDNLQRLNLLKKSSDDGNEEATLTLLDAYQNGWFGLDSKNAKVEQEGLALAKQYAGRGSERAIESILSAYKFGGFGLNPKNKQIQQQYLILAKKYAEKGSWFAAKMFAAYESIPYVSLSENRKEHLGNLLKRPSQRSVDDGMAFWMNLKITEVC